jgi:hypothetical protein
VVDDEYQDSYWSRCDGLFRGFDLVTQNIDHYFYSPESRSTSPER